MYDIISLNEKLLPELKEIAKKLSIVGVDGLKKQDLIYKILDHQALNPELVVDKTNDFVVPAPPVKLEKAAPKQAEKVAEKPTEKITEESSFESGEGADGRPKRRRIPPPRPNGSPEGSPELFQEPIAMQSMMETPAPKQVPVIQPTPTSKSAHLAKHFISLIPQRQRSAQFLLPIYKLIFPMENFPTELDLICFLEHLHPMQSMQQRVFQKL